MVIDIAPVSRHSTHKRRTLARIRLHCLHSTSARLAIACLDTCSQIVAPEQRRLRNDGLFVQIRFGENCFPRKHRIFTDTSYDVFHNAASARTSTFESPFDVQFDEVHKSEATMLGLSKDTIVDVLKASVCMVVDVRKRDDPQIVFGKKKNSSPSARFVVNVNDSRLQALMHSSSRGARRARARRVLRWHDTKIGEGRQTSTCE